MAEHARLSFSAAERWLRCPASVNMTKGMPDKPSEAAIEGTIAHEWLAKSLNNWVLLGDTTIICDDPEMGAHLQKCMDYVIQRYEELPGANKQIEIETRVDLHYMTGRDDLWGTSDIIISSDMYLDVIDLKYGQGIFVAGDTPQNRLYALGKMSQYMKDTKGEVPWASVRSTIMQPRIPDKDGEIFRFEDFYPEDLLDWLEEKVKPIAIITDNPPAPVAGEKQCQFCVAKTTCPAAEAKLSATMPFEPVAPLEGVEQIVKVGDLDVDRLVNIHDNIPFISGYLKAVTESLRALLIARDDRLTGKLKLVISNRTNMWDGDDDEILESLTKGPGRILKKDLVKESLVTAPQALKLSKLKPKQKARLQEHIKKGEGGLTIVPDSDPRANVFPSMPFEEAGKVASAQPFDFL